jgi:class 3 adenylate cyclase
VVIVVVCDVTGSTALAERLDPESLGLVMARWFDAVRAVLERHHGLLQKLIGDAVVAVFGVPVVREDDALRAVRAAAAMQDAVAELDAGQVLEVRTGVATGEVMVGDPMVAGEAVQLATRLQASAGPARSCWTGGPGGWRATRWWSRRCAVVLRLGGHAQRAAPLLAEAVALYQRKGNLVARDRAGDLLAGPPDA